VIGIGSISRPIEKIVNGMLDSLLTQFGSPKSSTSGNYAFRYEQYFTPLQDKRVKILEIGVGIGASLKVWKIFFPKADLIVGMDIINRCSHDLLVEEGNQTDKTFAKSIFTKYGYFDIIIEDGGTLQDQKIQAFHNYFPIVKPGGIYCVEHTQHSYESKNSGGLRKEGTIIEFLKERIDDLNFNGIAEKGLPYDRGDFAKILQSGCTLSYYEKEIDGIHFYSGLCFIFKRK